MVYRKLREEGVVVSKTMGEGVLYRRIKGVSNREQDVVVLIFKTKGGRASSC